MTATVKADYVVRGVDVVGTESYYTGKAGQEFVSHSITDAFGYNGVGAAQRRAKMLNNGSLIHGWRFMVVGRFNDEMRPASTIDYLIA